MAILRAGSAGKPSKAPLGDHFKNSPRVEAEAHREFPCETP